MVENLLLCPLQTYEAGICLVTELHVLAGAEVFSGTFSSNVGRLVVLQYEVLKMPRGSALSSDMPDWDPGRHLGGGEVNLA